MAGEAHGDVVVVEPEVDLVAWFDAEPVLRPAYDAILDRLG